MHTYDAPNGTTFAPLANGDISVVQAGPPLPFRHCVHVPVDDLIAFVMTLPWRVTDEQTLIYADALKALERLGGGTGRKP